MKKRLKFALLITIMSTTSILGMLPQQTNAAPSISVTIIDAYYTDADGGGVQNDVVVVTEFTIDGLLVNGLRYVIRITLPSGTTFTGIVFVITNMAQLSTTNYFYNTALESGWYEAFVYVDLNGNPYVSDTDHMVFDPPGGDNSDTSGFGVKVN